MAAFLGGSNTMLGTPTLLAYIWTTFLPIIRRRVVTSQQHLLGPFNQSFRFLKLTLDINPPCPTEHSSSPLTVCWSPSCLNGGDRKQPPGWDSGHYCVSLHSCVHSQPLRSLRDRQEVGVQPKVPSQVSASPGRLSVGGLVSHWTWECPTATPCVLCWMGERGQFNNQLQM